MSCKIFISIYKYAHMNNFTHEQFLALLGKFHVPFSPVMLFGSFQRWHTFHVLQCTAFPLRKLSFNENNNTKSKGEREVDDRGRGYCIWTTTGKGNNAYKCKFIYRITTIKWWWYEFNEIIMAMMVSMVMIMMTKNKILKMIVAREW